MGLKEIQSYVLLRGSKLSSEDKKRVLVESGAEDSGNLDLKRVSSSIRMLGSGFFQEYTGLKKDKQLRTYDHTAFVMEEQADDPETLADAFWTTDDIDDDTLEAMAVEDEDAALILQFEDAMADTIQNDADLAAFYSTYQDARRRLSERVRVRGFWPVRKGEKGKTKGHKGKSKGKGRPGSLAQRIANSYCRICFQKGHWKDECPMKKSGSSSSNPTSAPTSFAIVHEIPQEIQHLPVMTAVTEEARLCGSVVARRLCQVNNHHKGEKTVRVFRSFGNKKQSIRGQNQGFHNIASRFVSGLQMSLRRTKPNPGGSENPMDVPEHPPAITQDVVECHFASVGTIGVVDLGASQTVIGSSQVSDLLSKLEPHIRKQVHRTSCNLVFRFGNHQTLTSQHALMLPLHDDWFRIAVVPGQAPFLISSHFLKQTLKAVIDTDEGTLWSKTLNKHIPLIASNKNLFLLGLNHLWESGRNTLSFMCSEEQVQESSTTQLTTPSERDWKSVGEASESVHEASVTLSDNPKIHTENQGSHHTDTKDKISHKSESSQPSHIQKTSVSESLPSDQDRNSSSTSSSIDHVDTRPKVQGVQETDHRDQWRTSNSRCETNESGGTLQGGDQVWKHPRWQNLSRDVREPNLDSMVPLKLRNLNQGGSCQVLPVLRAVRIEAEMAMGSRETKSKAKSMPVPSTRTEKSWTHVEPEELCSEVEPDLVDVMEAPVSVQMMQMDDQVQSIRSENLNLSNRMNHVEMALQEILNHLKNTHIKNEP